MSIGIFAVIAKGQQALNILSLLKPVLGDSAPLVETITTVVGKALLGAKFGATTYTELVKELDGVIAEMEAIKERGGVTGDDFRNEVAKIKDRGNKIDEIYARLKS